MVRMLAVRGVVSGRAGDGRRLTDHRLHPVRLSLHRHVGGDRREKRADADDEEHAVDRDPRSMRVPVVRPVSVTAAVVSGVAAMTVVMTIVTQLLHV